MLCLIYIRPKRFSDNSIHSLKIYIQPQLNPTMKVSTQTIGSPDPILKNSMELDKSKPFKTKQNFLNQRDQVKSGQERTGHGRTIQDRAGEDRTDQVRTDHIIQLNNIK